MNAEKWSAEKFVDSEYQRFVKLLKTKAPNIEILPYEPLDFPHVYNGIKQIPKECDQIQVGEKVCWHGGVHWDFDFEPLIDRLAKFNFELFLDSARIWQDYEKNNRIDFSTYYEHRNTPGKRHGVIMWTLVPAESGDSVSAAIEISEYCGDTLLLSVPRTNPWFWAPHLMMFLETNYQALHYSDNIEELPEKVYHYKQEGHNEKGKKRTTSIVYKCRQFRISKVVDDDYIPTPHKPIQRKTESWGVCGHYRHYKSGKVGFVKPYVKGKREEVKPHIYIVNAPTLSVGVSS